MKYFTILIESLLLIFFGCAQNREHSEIKRDYLGNIAQLKYGNNAEYILSPDEKHLIVVNKKIQSPSNPIKLINFYVFSLTENRIIFEDSLLRGNVSWKSNSQVEVKRINEVYSQKERDNKTGYLYDIELNKKIYFK